MSLQVIYAAAQLDTTITGHTPEQVFAVLKDQYAELSNGTYEVVNGVMTISLREGRKA